MVSTSDLLAFLGSSAQRVLHTREMSMTGVGALATATAGDLAFCGTTGPAAIAAMRASGASVVLCSASLLHEHGWPEDVMYIGTANPRLDFSRVYQHFFETAVAPAIHQTVVVGRHCRIEASVSIGPHSTIGNDVTVGAGSRIGSGVFVGDGTRIGADCTVHANAVIGEPGFGFERDESGRAIPFPHVGRVVIGDRVSIGANSCIARGALSDTRIDDDVQIDSHVHVAHNVHIGRAATIVAHSSISGSATIEAEAWLSPGTLVMGQMTVGAGAKVGVGSVVTKPVKAGVTVFGNPARTVWAGK